MDFPKVMLASIDVELTGVVIAKEDVMSTNMRLVTKINDKIVDSVLFSTDTTCCYF